MNLPALAFVLIELTGVSTTHVASSTAETTETDPWTGHCKVDGTRFRLAIAAQTVRGRIRPDGRIVHMNFRPMASLFSILDHHTRFVSARGTYLNGAIHIVADFRSPRASTEITWDLRPR